MSSFVLDPPCDLINANQRLHYQAKAKLTKAWREAAAAQGRHLPKFVHAHIVVAIRFPTNHRRDVGNYYPTAKALVDGLVDADALLDDSDVFVLGPDMRREYPNGPARVTVTITEVQP